MVRNGLEQRIDSLGLELMRWRPVEPTEAAVFGHDEFSVSRQFGEKNDERLPGRLLAAVAHFIFFLKSKLGVDNDVVRANGRFFAQFPQSALFIGLARIHMPLGKIPSPRMFH